MRRWNEQDHPRDRRGRFRGKTGGDWAGAIADGIGEALTGHRPARGQDLTRSDQVDWAGLAAQVRAESGDNFIENGPDSVLGRIYEMQGYHGKPRVVSREEMDRLIGDGGYVEMWRGMAGFGATPELSNQRAEEFRSDPSHRPGRGIYGNGSYFAADFDVVRGYARFDDQRADREFGAKNFEAQDQLYFDPHSGYWTGLVRAALPPDARVLNIREAQDWYRQNIAGDGRDRDQWSDRTWVLADEGRAAAMRGYDAIRVPDDYGAGRGSDYYVLLNRSALVVQEGP
jgi:hypothetical protein